MTKEHDVDVAYDAEKEIEIIEEYQNGEIIGRKINGIDTPISGIEENSEKVKVSYKSYKNKFGDYRKLFLI